MSRYRTWVNNATPAINANNLNVIEDRLPYISVTDSSLTGGGAVGDGSTDDTAAIQAAINAVGNNPNGGTVFFPAASAFYSISGTLLIPDNVTLRGVGYRPQAGEVDGQYTVGKGSRIRTTVDAPIFKNLNADPNSGLNARIEILDLSLEGNAITTNAAIHFHRVWRARIEGCWVQTNPTPGTQVAAIRLHDSEQVDVFCSVVQGGSIYVLDGRVINIVRCEIAGPQGYGIEFIGGFGGFGCNVAFCHVYSDSAPGTTRDGIVLHRGTQEVTVMGCQLEMMARNGILLDRGAHRNRIIGNYCKKNANGNTGQYDGIQIDCSDATEGDTRSNIVIGNTCYDPQSPKKQRYGISVLSTVVGACHDNLVAHNMLTDNLTGALFVGSDAVFDANEIYDNYGVADTWPQSYHGAADPTAGGGVPAAVGSLYMRKAVGVYKKTGSGATAWTLL